MESRDTTLEQIEAYILELLAADTEDDPDRLRTELAALNSEMPIDSLLLVEVMTRVEARFGVRLEPTEDTAKQMSSVRAFAELVRKHMTADMVAEQPGPASSADRPSSAGH